MSAELIPRIGKLVPVRAEQLRPDKSHAEGTPPGGALPKPAWSPLTASSNVIRIVWPNDAAKRAAKIGISGPDDRPAPPIRTRDERWRLAAMLLVAAFAHAAALGVFNRAPPPLASVGIKAMTVELVLGTNAAAGTADRPTDSEAPFNAAAAKGDGAEAAKPETARSETEAPAAAVPTEQPVEIAKAATTPPNVEPPRVNEIAPVRAVKPVEPPEEPVAAVEPITVPSDPPEPQTLVQLPRPRPQVPVASAPPPKPKTASVRPTPAKPKPPTNTGKGARTVAAAPSTPSVASSGIGRGRSDAAANYRGLVAARLARNKVYPADARRNGDQGRAIVSFTIASSGGATRVSLIRSSGVASLDREAVAMVRRASPFPPPPSGASIRFTVPVNFDLR